MTLRDLLVGESQNEPHYWASVFGAHCWIMLGVWGLLATAFNMWFAAWVTPLGYLILWEGLQLALSRKRTAALFWDSILDTVAVAFACYAAACLGNGMQIAAFWAWSASFGVMAAGWGKRS